MKLIIIFVIKYDFYIHNNAFDCEKYIIVKNTHTHTYICKMHIVTKSLSYLQLFCMIRSGGKDNGPVCIPKVSGLYNFFISVYGLTARRMLPMYV